MAGLPRSPAQVTPAAAQPRREITRAGHPDADRERGHVVANHRRCADDGVLADVHAVENFRPGADPGAGSDVHAGRRPRLREHRARRIGEIVVAADDVTVRGHQDAGADRDPARRKHFAVEADVGAVGELDVAVLARQDRIASDEDAAPDADAAIRFALRVQQAVVVDDHVIADVNLVRVTQDDVLPEDDVAAARSEEQRIQRLPQRQSERARREPATA